MKPPPPHRAVDDLVAGAGEAQLHTARLERNAPCVLERHRRRHQRRTGDTVEPFDALERPLGELGVATGSRILAQVEIDPNEPFGLAIRTYAESPRHTDRHLEACLTLKDEHGTAVPGTAGCSLPATAP